MLGLVMGPSGNDHPSFAGMTSLVQRCDIGVKMHRRKRLLPCSTTIKHETTRKERISNSKQKNLINITYQYFDGPNEIKCRFHN
jgi:hypothetical protein